MHLELADIDDLPALHALVESAFRGDSARQGWSHEADLLDGQRTDLDELRDIIADPSQRVLVFRDGEGIRACVAISDKGRGTAYLGMLTVDPTQQAAGLGRMMMAAAEDRAVADFGATRMELTIIPHRTELAAWYERRGYRATGERRPWPVDNPRFGLPKVDDLEFVVMEKAL